MQRQSVGARDAGGLRSKTGAVQYAVEPVAGFVAGEHAAGAVRPVSAGGQPENQNARVRVSKAGDGFAPILPFPIGSALDRRYLGAMVAQTGTSLTGDYLCLDNLEQYEPNLIYAGYLKFKRKTSKRTVEC
jgi:hypothetical protein